MATEEVMRVSDSLAGMIPALRQALEQGETHEQYLRQLANEQAKENTRVRKVINTLDPPPSPSKANGTRRKKQPPRIGTKTAGGTATGFGISVEACGVFVDEILKQAEANDGYVNQKDVYRALDQDQTKGSAAFRYLRDIGFLRKAGREPDTRRERYALDNPDAYEKVLKELDSGD